GALLWARKDEVAGWRGYDRAEFGKQGQGESGAGAVVGRLAGAPGRIVAADRAGERALGGVGSDDAGECGRGGGAGAARDVHLGVAGRYAARGNGEGAGIMLPVAGDCSGAWHGA